MMKANDPMSESLPFLNLKNPNFSTKGPEITSARDGSWCAKTPFGLAVLRYREVGLLLRDKRLRQGSYAWPDKNKLEGSFAEFWKRSIISREGKDHRCLLYTSPSPRDLSTSRMPSSA